MLKQATVLSSILMTTTLLGSPPAAAQQSDPHGWLGTETLKQSAFTESENDKCGLHVREEGLKRLLGRVETVAIDHGAK